MSLDQNESVERTLEEILAELDLLPSPSATPEAPVSEEAATPQPEPAAPQKPLVVSVSTETARPAPESVEKVPEPVQEETVEADDEIPEPSTMVFSPSRLREQMKAAAEAAAAPQKTKVSPPSSASLKAELRQLARSGDGHTVTEHLRAQDPVKAESMPGKKLLSTARKTAVQRTVPKTVPEVSSDENGEVKTSRLKKEVIEWAKALLIALAATFFIFFVLIRVVNVNGTSMQPTLEPGDRLVISGLFYEPENGDVVVTTSKNGLGKPLIKRVIALGGQTVDIAEDGSILVNGLVLEEDYLDKAGMDVGDLTFPLTVPEGTLFLVGDNRAVSVDSRSSLIGMVSEKELEGKVLFRFWPLNRLGGVK